MSAPKNNVRLHGAIIFSLFLAALYLSFFFILNIKTLSDDSIFLNAATSGISTLDYLSERYATWTGRIAIEGIMFTTIALPIFWKLAIPTCLLLAAYSIWKSFFSDKISYCLGVPLCLFGILTINHSILDDTVFYITGFYNYLLPISCGLFASAVFIRPSTFTITERALAIPLTFIASQSEQVGISIMVILSATMIWEHKKPMIYRALLLLITAIGFFLLLTAPGNYLRLESEVIYMPEFNDYSLLRKLLTGFDVFNANYINPTNLYPKAIAILLVLLAKDKIFELKRTALILAVLGVLQASIFSPTFMINDTEHYSIRYLNSGFGIVYFCSYILSIASLTSMIYIMMKSLENRTSFYFGSLVLLLYIGTTTLIGLSPTAYESGYRALFVGDVLGLILICVLFRGVTGWQSQSATSTH